LGNSASRNNYRFACLPVGRQLALKGEKKRLAIPPLAGFCCFATANRILRERELFFEPRGAWQILSKSALPASGGLAEPRRGEATNAEHTIWLRTLNEIRTFSKKTPSKNEVRFRLPPLRYGKPNSAQCIVFNLVVLANSRSDALTFRLHSYKYK